MARRPSNGNVAHLAIVCVQPDAVVRASGHGRYDSYSLYLAANVARRRGVDSERNARSAHHGAVSEDGIDLRSAESMLLVTKPRVGLVTRAGQ